jgi:hypothetical protein
LNQALYENLKTLVKKTINVKRKTTPVRKETKSRKSLFNNPLFKRNSETPPKIEITRVDTKKEEVQEEQVEEEEVVSNEKKEKFSLGEIFTRFTPYLKLYSVYINNFTKSIECLDIAMKDSKLKLFLKDSMRKYGGDLGSFLITPIQRIPRYSLLLKEIIKITPSMHPDIAALNKSLDLIQGKTFKY